MHRYALSLLILSACSRGDHKPTTPDQDDAPTCEATAARMTEHSWRMLEHGGAGSDIVEQARTDAEAIEPQLAQACADDGWSRDLRRCIVDDLTVENDKVCDALITDPQVQHVIEIREAAGGDE